MSGSLTSGEKRTSRNATVAGAGFASRPISASASSVAAVAHSIGSSVSAASSLRRFGFPEVIKVEPIVRGIARVVFQPGGKARGHFLQMLFAARAFQGQRVRE